MDIENLLIKKKRDLISYSADGDERKTPPEASSFDDSVAKAANNGEVFEEDLQLDDCVAILCNSIKSL